jgi:predicted RNA binding protein YcfA (HicA-like mRNA interferase family)
MPKLPGVRHQDAIRVFERLGYRIVRQGGHIVMSNGETRLIIPPGKSDRPLHNGKHSPLSSGAGARRTARVCAQKSTRTR